jgi:hypothetical protein
MSREFDHIEKSYQDLDPEMSEAKERERLAALRYRRSVQAQAKLDRQNLVKNPVFIRWLFTELERAGILDPTFHAQEGATQYLAGFRAFGLAMLKDLEADDHTLMIALMVERSKSLEKAKNDRHDSTDDRDAE